MFIFSSYDSTHFDGPNPLYQPDLRARHSSELVHVTDYHPADRGTADDDVSPIRI